MIKSKLIKLAVFAGLIGLLPVVGMAQVDFSIQVAGSAFTAINGSANTEIDGVATNAAGTIQYIADSISTFDGIARWNGTTLTVFATEAQLDAPNPSPNASFADMDCDSAGVLYICFAGTGFGEKIWRVPGDDFANAVSMMATADVGEANGIAVDEANSRLLVAYNDFNGVAPAPSFGEGLGSIPLNATDANVTEIASEADLTAALDTVTGGGQDIDPIDIGIQSDGTIIMTHGFSSASDFSGTILKIDSLGNATALISANDLITALGGDGSTINIGNVELHILSDDKIFLHIQFSNNNAVFPPRFVVGSPQGTNWVTLATHDDMYADSDLSALTSPLNMDGKHGDMDSNENYYFYDQLNNTIAATAVIKMTGIRAAITASVNEWSLY